MEYKKAYKFFKELLKPLFLVFFILLGLAITEQSKACQPLQKVTEAVYFEARGEPFHGQLAVATVIMNRVYDGRWGDTVCDVVNQPSQFSYMSDGKPETMTKPLAMQTAREVADCVLTYDCQYVTVEEAKWYYACDGPNKMEPAPAWTQAYTYVAKINNHCFYKEG